MNQPVLQVVLASANPGKLLELRRCLAPSGLSLVGLGELGLSQADEPHPGFVENALAKARAASAASGLPALADDSGLMVDALAGRPGVHSARAAELAGSGLWSREGLSADQANCLWLQAVLAGQGASLQRPITCRFVAALALVRSAEDPLPLLATGVWEGEVLDSPRGEGGFGYDPLFWDPRLERSAAELQPEAKDAVSHRGRALVRLLEAVQRDPRWAVDLRRGQSLR